VRGLVGATGGTVLELSDADAGPGIGPLTIRRRTRAGTPDRRFARGGPVRIASSRRIVVQGRRVVAFAERADGTVQAASVAGREVRVRSWRLDARRAVDLFAAAPATDGSTTIAFAFGASPSRPSVLARVDASGRVGRRRAVPPGVDWNVLPTGLADGRILAAAPGSPDCRRRLVVLSPRGARSTVALPPSQGRCRHRYALIEVDGRGGFVAATSGEDGHVRVSRWRSTR